MNDVKLRDKRKPGHCWQDNELYDAFGPVIGPNAILVYVQMSRNCYGGSEIRYSSRDLARDAGLSKDTVLRAMRVMERVGMLRAVAGGRGKVAEYHLTDLKELAEHHGGIHNWSRQSYVFSTQQMAALKAMASGVEFASATVAVGDSLPVATVAVGDSVAPPLALQQPTTGAGEARPYTRQQDIQDKNNLPPTPATAGERMTGEMELQAALGNLNQRLLAEKRGSAAWLWLYREIMAKTAQASELRAAREAAEAREREECEAAELLQTASTATADTLVLRVMLLLGFADEGLRAPLCATLQAAASPGRGQLLEAAAMVHAWRSYLEAGPLLRFTWGPKKFFLQGHWKNPSGWPVDRERQERKAAAKVGG